MADYEIPTDLRYTEEDEWAREAEGRVRVGITDYAQTQLGDVVYVDVPEAGTAVRRGEAFGTIESVKTVADLYAPVSGELAEVNPALADAPEKVNEDCYGEGWLVAITPSDAAELESLLDAEAYRKHVASRGE